MTWRKLTGKTIRVAVLAAALLIPGAAHNAAARAATLTLNPTSGETASVVAASGTGLGKHKSGTVTFGATQVLNFTTNSSGAFGPSNFYVPPGYSGATTVTARTSSASANQSYNVLVPQSGADPSGEAMPVGDIAGWHQIVAQNFADQTIPLGQFPAGTNGAWDAYPDGWHDTSGNGTYSCTKVCSVANGLLDVYVHSENGVHYVAVPYPNLPAPYASTHNGHLYMRTAVRFKSDAIHCYKTAWLYWPDSETWPRDGEIDFPEGDLDSTIDAFMHHQDATSGSDQDGYRTSATYTSWHTAVTEWTASSVKFYLDGNLIGNSTTRIPNTPMHWLLPTETGLSGCVPDNAAAGHVQIDWASVYVPG